MSVRTNLGIADPALGWEEGPNDLEKTPSQTYLLWFSICLSQVIEYTHYHCSSFS